MLSKVVKTYISKIIRFSHCVSSTRHFHGNIIKYSSRADFRMAPNVFRQQKIYSALVTDIFDASSTIKILRLHVKEEGFSFKAGQWVDFYVPGISEVTGYSMTLLQRVERRDINCLLIWKFLHYKWFIACSPGEEVQIRVGGDFFYDPLSDNAEAESNLVLVGGGVGINPLVSILLEYRDLLRSTINHPESEIEPGKVHLLYSARTECELVFRDQFTIMEKEHPSLTCQYFVTRPEQNATSPVCRIGEKNVADSIKSLAGKRTLCFVCGPSTMTDDVASWFLKLGIPKENVRYEKWW
ncbi:hypothetical protein JTE90_013755 [Oedothorax gibbosus]|uniref:Oxidoreductase FAD/NAD(P)-binding domain-containing protein n=1 Tax=Oedothorax gibbosus TaxID=931172 RepID=A0AAV6UZU1_9ARAC|nr:hypothetical protein JTE90_013755 [Oedothorax gibbosus]